MTDKPTAKARFYEIKVDKVHSNLSQEIIETTSDKMTIVLTEYVRCLEKSNDWKLPLSLFLTVVLVLLTSTFKKAFSLSGDAWEVVFCCSAVGFAFWFVKALINRKSAQSIADVLTAIKTQK